MGSIGQGRNISHLDNYRNAIIPSKKVGNYLLNPTKKPDKARLFRSLGYNMRNAARFIEDIKKQLALNSAIKYETNEYGDTMYTVVMPLGINRTELIHTVWNKKRKTSEPRLVTAYKASKKEVNEYEQRKQNRTL